MRDLISRQAAIEAASRGCFELRGIFQIIKEEIEALPSAQPEQRWILCDDRLPEEDGQYLITVKYKHEDGYDDIYAEHGEWCNGKWDMFCFGHCGDVESILAWCELPEPYKEKQDG